MSAIVTINSEEGLVDHLIVPGAVNTEIFLDYINQLFHVLGGRNDVVIFMDNLMVHHTKLVAARLLLFEWIAVFNAAYSSELHCIEVVFASVKFNYRKSMAEMTGKVIDQLHRNLIQKAIEGVSTDLIQRIIAKFERNWKTIVTY